MCKNMKTKKKEKVEKKMFFGFISNGSDITFNVVTLLQCGKILKKKNYINCENLYFYLFIFLNLLCFSFKFLRSSSLLILQSHHNGGCYHAKPLKCNLGCPSMVGSNLKKTTNSELLKKQKTNKKKSPKLLHVFERLTSIKTINKMHVV